MGRPEGLAEQNAALGELGCCVFYVEAVKAVEAASGQESLFKN
jgi:hypothetical protein